MLVFLPGRRIYTVCVSLAELFLPLATFDQLLSPTVQDFCTAVCVPVCAAIHMLHFAKEVKKFQPCPAQSHACPGMHACTHAFAAAARSYWCIHVQSAASSAALCCDCDPGSAPMRPLGPPRCRTGWLWWPSARTSPPARSLRRRRRSGVGGAAGSTGDWPGGASSSGPSSAVRACRVGLVRCVGRACPCGGGPQC